MLRFRPDMFMLSLLATLAAATALPCQGESAQLITLLGKFAIGTLFFLQGARLSRDAVLGGMTHWRLHIMIAGTTFVLFPLLGSVFARLAPGAMQSTLWLGVLYLCALPSTIQSSIALTSIARGNVPGALCAATASNLGGMLLTPVLLGLMVHLHGSGPHIAGAWQILAQLLLPFVAGHLLRPYIGEWVQRHRPVLGITDRGSILLVVYAAFSAAVVHGIWHQVPPTIFATLFLICTALLALALAVMRTCGRLFFRREDEIAIVFCGMQKSLVTGVPMASVLFAGPNLGLVVLPLMIYYPMQLLVCAVLARRYAAATEPLVPVTAAFAQVK